MKTTSNNYFITAYGYDLLIPKGTKTTHQTACGIDEKYNFVANTTDIQYKDGDTGEYRNVDKWHGPHHDLYYYGINIPKEFIH